MRTATVYSGRGAKKLRLINNTKKSFQIVKYRGLHQSRTLFELPSCHKWENYLITTNRKEEGLPPGKLGR